MPFFAVVVFLAWGIFWRVFIKGLLHSSAVGCIGDLPLVLRFAIGALRLDGSIEKVGVGYK